MSPPRSARSPAGSPSAPSSPCRRPSAGRAGGAPMPVVRDPGDLPARQGAGWAEQAWAGPQELGAPVPMQAWRWSLAPMAASPPIGLGAPEGLLYVMAGAGIAETDGGRFAVGLENVLWLGGCPEIALHAGARGLEVLIAQAPGRGHPPGRGRPELFTAADLPHLVSTRDARDRLDLVSDAVPVGARQIRANRMVYRPGVSALTGPGELHWFVNDSDADFAFVEFWAPPPADTVWPVAADRCTWAPVS